MQYSEYDADAGTSTSPDLRTMPPHKDPVRRENLRVAIIFFALLASIVAGAATVLSIYEALDPWTYGLAAKLYPSE